MKLNNKQSMYGRRSALRNNMTEEERILWSVIKNKGLSNLKFRRQHSVGYYILDFYCPEKKLGIELDGSFHFNPDTVEYDKNREEVLNSLGLKVIHYNDLVVLNNSQLVEKDFVEQMHKRAIELGLV